MGPICLRRSVYEHETASFPAWWKLPISSSLQGKHHLSSPRSYFTVSGMEAKKPLCCTHKCNWIPEKPAQLISTLRSFSAFLLKVQPGICRNWHFLGACEKCGTPGISHHCVQGRKYSLHHWEEGETADPEAKLSASSFSAIVRAHIVLPPFSFF